MTWHKGTSGNASGRPKGSKNKAGGEIRQRIESFLTDNFESIAKDFEELEPKERYRLFIGLLPYCIGKKQDLTFEGQIGRLTDQELDEVIDVLKQRAQPCSGDTKSPY